MLLSAQLSRSASGKANKNLTVDSQKFGDEKLKVRYLLPMDNLHKSQAYFLIHITKRTTKI